MGGVGAEGGLGREGEALAVEVGALEVATPGEDGLGDVRLGDADAEVVVDGPEASVEEVVGAGRKRVRLLGGSLTPFRISLCPRAPSRPLVVVSQILVQRSNGKA